MTTPRQKSIVEEAENLICEFGPPAPDLPKYRVFFFIPCYTSGKSGIVRDRGIFCDQITQDFG